MDKFLLICNPYYSRNRKTAKLYLEQQFWTLQYKNEKLGLIKILILNALIKAVLVEVSINIRKVKMKTPKFIFLIWKISELLNCCDVLLDFKKQFDSQR